MTKEAVLSLEDSNFIKKSLEEGETIERIVNFSWDGSNLLLRIPKEISQFLNLNKDNRFEKSLKFIIKGLPEKSINTFEVIERTTPKKLIKKKHGKNKHK